MGYLCLLALRGPGIAALSSYCGAIALQISISTHATGFPAALLGQLSPTQLSGLQQPANGSGYIVALPGAPLPNRANWPDFRGCRRPSFTRGAILPHFPAAIPAAARAAGLPVAAAATLPHI